MCYKNVLIERAHYYTITNQRERSNRDTTVFRLSDSFMLVFLSRQIVRSFSFDIFKYPRLPHCDSRNGSQFDDCWYFFLSWIPLNVTRPKKLSSTLSKNTEKWLISVPSLLLVMIRKMTRLSNIYSKVKWN